MQHEDLTREMFADIRVVQERQLEINRRMGTIEETISSLRERLVDSTKLADVEQQLEELTESQGQWVRKAAEIIFTMAVTTLGVWAASKFGVTPSW